MLPFEIAKRLEEIKGEIAAMGAELVDVSVHRTGARSVMTVIVDKDGGVTLDDCVAINQRLSRLFDELDTPGDASGRGGVFGGAYTLEVSSPGLDRPLKTERDFERALNERVRVHYPDERGIVQPYVGRLLSVTNGTIELKDEKKNAPIRYFAVAQIVKAVREIGFN